MRIMLHLADGPKSIRELIRLMFPSSTSTVLKYVNFLMDKGLLEELKVSSKRFPRVIKLSTRGEKLVEHINVIVREIKGE